MADLACKTVDCLSELYLSNLDKDWVNQVWETDFCESCSLPQRLIENSNSKRFYIEALKSILEVLKQWCNSVIADKQPLGFWAVLVENGMSHHSLVALLYSFISLSKKHSKVSPKMLSSVVAANIYLSLNKIPGSGAYKIFHSLLFQKACDVLQLWPTQSEDPKGKRKKVSASQTRKKSKRGSTENEEGWDDLSDDEDDDDSIEESIDISSSYDQQSLKKDVKTAMIQFFLDLTNYLESNSLKDVPDTLEHITSLLVDLTRLEVVSLNDFNTDINRTQATNHKSLNKICYKALEYLVSLIHGETGEVLRKIFKHLILNILSTYKTSCQSTSITQEKQLVKDTAVAFVCFIYQKIGEDSMLAVRCLIQHLCTQVTDNAEYRLSVGKALVIIFYCLTSENQKSILEWITKYSKNAKTGYRVFALELFVQLLKNPPCSDENRDKERQQPNDFHVHLLQLIASRCSDKSAVVRAKALTHLAECISSGHEDISRAVTKLLNMQMTTGSMESHVTPAVTEGQEAPFDNSILAMIRRRVSDQKVLVRKAALQVLESIIRLRKDTLCKEDLGTIRDRTLDQALSVRKQAMTSITTLLVENPDSPLLHSIWLDALLPVVMDRETTAQEKCLQYLENNILQNIVQESRDESHSNLLAWKLLHLIAGPSGYELRHYFQKVCYYWAKEKKFTATKVQAIMSHLTTENASAAWLLLAEVSSFKPKLDYKTIVNCWKEYKTSGPDKQEILCHILKVLENLAEDIPNNDKETLIDQLQAQLSMFKCLPNVIASCARAMIQLCESLPHGKVKIEQWSLDVLNASELYLSSVIFNPDNETVNVDEETIMIHLFTIGEASSVCPKNVTKRLYLIIQSIIFTSTLDNKDTSTNTGPSVQKCSLSLSSKVKAFAVNTLGKLCLQNDTLAKDCIPALAKELQVSDEPAIRNNITIVMCDLCVRYTNLVDRYIPVIACGLKDKEPLVRKQTLTMITNLLQEDYVKWKGSLFFHFISVLVDDDSEIKDLADFCLVRLLLVRNPSMFHQHFIECIFHFNGYDKHKVYNQFIQTEREKQLFSLKGEAKISKRMTIYKFLLDNTTDEHRFNLTQKLCQEVLSGFVDGIIPFTDDAKPLLKDALAVLSSKNIKISTQTCDAEDLADDGDQAGAAMVHARTKFLTQVVKKNMIENIVPIIIELKTMLEKHRSALLKDLMLCLKTLMKDYRTEIQDVLSADRQLANEIEFDLRRFEEEQKEQQQLQQLAAEPVVHNSPCRNSASNTPGTTTPVTPSKTGFVTPILRSPAGSTPVKPESKDGQNVPCTPPPKTPLLGNKSLRSAVLMNSARKAIASARKVGLQHSNTPNKNMAAPTTSIKKIQATKENNLDVTVSPKQRIASTPGGDVSQLPRISFCINNSSTAPLSPIVNIIPAQLSKHKGKEISSPTENEAIPVLCLHSPAKPAPKQRTWNIQSPTPSAATEEKKTLRNRKNESIAERTRSRRPSKN